ncbi:RE1 [Symbiodinium sp. CCMP2592]|nr:RE1 [Symbiodinium sp. CCMP2592]
MMQATAEAKARRAEQTKTRRSGELLQLEPGDVVEFWRKASTKDIEAWHGPAVVADVTSLRDGQISVRWQGTVSFRFGSNVSSLPGVNCDESMLLFWSPGQLEAGHFAFMAGNQHVNFARLCGKSDLAFVQFFAEDQEAIHQLRQVVVDIPNVGGMHDPTMPALQDVTAQVQRRTRQRLMLEDPQPEVRLPEVYDIATPDDATARTAETASETEPEQEPLFSTYVFLQPEVILDPAWESSFVVDKHELQEEPPQLLFPFTQSHLLLGAEELIRTIPGFEDYDGQQERLEPIPEAELKLLPAEQSASQGQTQQFMSLVGGLAWVVQTRPDVAVFVAALQRRLKAPVVKDLINANRVLKYLKAKPLELVYRKVRSPWKLVVVSDSAFKGEEQDCLAMRSCIIALAAREGLAKGENQLQILEFVSKKQSKVCRSTFAAELHSCLDAIGAACVINAALTEVLNGVSSATELAAKQDAGSQSLALDVAIDAKSVWAAVGNDTTTCTDQLVNFKGEDGKTKKKRRDKKAFEPDVEDLEKEGGASAGQDMDDKDVPVMPGSGRLVTNTTTVHGFDSKFKDELEVGDTIMVHHPTSLEVELRMVVSVLSQRSCVIHQSFSKDCNSTVEYHIRKDSLKIKEKAKSEIQEDNPELLQDAASRELQRQLDKRLKKQSKTVSVREKTGMWGYKVVTKKLDKTSSAEDALDERCKQGLSLLRHAERYETDSVMAEPQEPGHSEINREVQRLRAAVRGGRDFERVRVDMVEVIKRAFPDDAGLVYQLQSAAESIEGRERTDEEAPFGTFSEPVRGGASFGRLERHCTPANIFDESPHGDSVSDVDSLVCDTKSRESSFISVARGGSFFLDRSLSERDAKGCEEEKEEPTLAALRGGWETKAEEEEIFERQGSSVSFQLFPSKADEDASRALLSSRKQIYKRLPHRSSFPSPGSRRAGKDDPRQLLMRYFGKIVRRKLKQSAASRASRSVNSSSMMSSEVSQVSTVLASSDSGRSVSPRMWSLNLEPRAAFRPPLSWRPRRAPVHGKAQEEKSSDNTTAVPKAAGNGKARCSAKGHSDVGRVPGKVSQTSSKVAVERGSKAPNPRKFTNHEDPRWEKVKCAAQAKPRSKMHSLEAIMVERSGRKQMIRSERLHKAPEADRRCEEIQRVEAWTPEPIRLVSSSGERDWTTGMARLAHTPDVRHPDHLAEIWEEVARRPASVAEVRSRLEAPRPASQQAAIRVERVKASKPPTSADWPNESVDVGAIWEVVN